MVLKLVPFEIYLYLRWLVKIPVFLRFVFLSVWRENESQRWVALFRGEPLKRDWRDRKRSQWPAHNSVDTCTLPYGS